MSFYNNPYKNHNKIISNSSLIPELPLTSSPSPSSPVLPLTINNSGTISSRSCRMSWFLVQQLESKILSIIHSVDLVHDTNADIYLNKTITFNRDQSIIEAIIYLSGREILIEDGNEKRLATILHFSANENEMMKEMQLLKEKSSHLALEESSLNKNFKWFLIQYSNGLNNVIYSIINEDETIWGEDNYFNDFVTYLQDDTCSAIYQSIILKKSKYRDELEIELENIKEHSLVTVFPLNGNNEI
ncbi:early boundary activity protein 3-like [Condylostylus longicornis]|uniref:early boundary activity protein 3-like n=1 Tax=Condylostylus longicornis TaxID=2530218 RepID=UPI00244E1BA2|nr:early boundary activity protein 3-like [Condylostylus longicornis]